MANNPKEISFQPPAEPKHHHARKISKIDKMMSKWKDVLQDNESNLISLNDPNEAPLSGKEAERRNTIELEYNTYSSGSISDGEFLPYASSISLGSIECQAITIETDFHSGPKQFYESDSNNDYSLKSKNEIPSASLLGNAEKKLMKYTKRVTKYYDNLWKEFEEVESILRLPNVRIELQGNINSLSAQLWFAIYLQAREFNSNLEQQVNDTHRNQLHFLSRHFHTISKAGKVLVTLNGLLRKCLTTFETIGKDYISKMKFLLTGNSATDLMRINELTPYDNLLQTPDLWIMNNYKEIQNTALLKQLTNNKCKKKPISLGKMLAEHRQFIKMEYQTNSKKFPNARKQSNQNLKGLQEVKLKASNNKKRRKQSPQQLNPFNQIVHDFRDSLDERRKMDIFMKNVTKSGWMDYETKFPKDQKPHLIRELINHTIIGFQKLMKHIPKLMKLLKHGNNPIGFCYFLQPNTFLPWIHESSKIIHYCNQHENWMIPGDFERLRFNVLANEVQLNSLIGKGKQVQKHVQNVIKTINISSNFMYHIYKIKIPKYSYYHELMTSELKASDPFYHDFTHTKENDYDDEEFYLSDYSQILKHVPLYFHITEFILSKRLPLEETKVFGTGTNSDIQFF